jgi:hypothetical protein
MQQWYKHISEEFDWTTFNMQESKWAKYNAMGIFSLHMIPPFHLGSLEDSSKSLQFLHCHHLKKTITTII